MNQNHDLRVVFLSYDFGEYSIRLANALAQDAAVRLILPIQLAQPHLDLLDPAVDFQPFHKPRLRQPLAQLRTNALLLRRIREFRPDVVHLQQGHLWFNFALPFLGATPLVITAHDPRRHLGDRGGQKTPQWVHDFGFRRARQLIVHGAPLVSVLVEELGIPRERIHVIPHHVLGDDTACPHVAEEPNTVLFFGRIWPYKGLDVLIRAEPAITARVPDARFVIAGTGEELARYRRMMAHPERFTVIDRYVSDEERAALFRQASLVVLPYLEATQSGVIPVAYTYAKPVVATTVGGLPDLVEHGRTGLLVPPRDEQALADAIVALLQDPERRRRMGQQGKIKIETECSPQAAARQTLAVYRRALAERASPVTAMGEASQP